VTFTQARLSELKRAREEKSKNLAATFSRVEISVKDHYKPLWFLHKNRKNILKAVVFGAGVLKTFSFISGGKKKQKNGLLSKGLWVLKLLGSSPVRGIVPVILSYLISKKKD
jgi:hypothetical protein